MRERKLETLEKKLGKYYFSWIQGLHLRSQISIGKNQQQRNTLCLVEESNVK